MTPAEREVIFLKAANDIVDSMVNREMLNVHGPSDDSVILFSTVTHQRLFNVLLVDFLSRTDRRGPVDQDSFIGGIRVVAQDPQFLGPVDGLAAAITSLEGWLDFEPKVPVWLPSLNVEATLQLSRLLYLKMSGDIAKHNLLRAVGVAERLRSALRRGGFEVDVEDALLALEDFYARYHTDILNYHATQIVEMLNNIRWGIHEYLLPEFERSYEADPERPPLYGFDYPAAVTGKFARDRYWALMNDVRRGPIIPRFMTTRNLIGRY